jgi:hypothetical protein
MRLSSVINHGKRTLKYHIESVKPIQSPEELVDKHFKSWSDLNHVNFQLFKSLARELSGKPAFIVETGTSAYGTDSTRFWDSYIRKFGGKIISIDIRENAGIQLKFQLHKNTELVTSDSVKYLKNHPFDNVDLYYFDSADVDWASPEFSINHGLAELLAVVDNLKPGMVIVFDDTPKSENYVEEHLRKYVMDFQQRRGFFPGKGSLAIKMLAEKFNLQVLHHEYAYACKIMNRIQN